MSYVATTVIWLVIAAWAGNLAAQTEGQADLDRALQIKIKSRTLGDLGEVIRLCESALAKGLDLDNEQFARSLLAATRIQRGLQYAEERLSTDDPDWPKVRRLALEDLQKGLELDPNHARAWFQVARLNLLPGGNPRVARLALDRAIDTSVEEPTLRAEAYLLRASLQSGPQDKLKDLNAAIEANPKLTMAYRLRGALYADLQEEEKALADLDKALELEPDHPLTLQLRGIILAEMKRYDEALKVLEKVHELQPQALAPLLEQARILGLQTNFQEALERLDQALKLQPDNPAILVLRASVFIELKELAKALTDLDRALELQPDLPIAMRLKAMVLIREGRLGEAVRELRRLRGRGVDNPLVLLQLGLLELAAGRPRAAIEQLSRFLESEPENGVALSARADAYLSIGKHAEAIADFEKAVELAPDNATVLNNFAWVLATSPDEHLRDGKRALPLAQKACELTEFKAAYAVSTLAACYAELGDFESAIRWAEKAVELATGSEKEQLLQELESYRNGKPWRERQEKPEEAEEADIPVESPPGPAAPTE